MYIDGCVSFPFPSGRHLIHPSIHTCSPPGFDQTLHIHYTTLHYTNYVDEIYINQHPPGVGGGERYDMTLTHLESNQIKIRSDSD